MTVIEVSSAAYEQGNYFRVTIDGKKINMQGGERGIGLVIVEKGTRKVKFARVFDTYLDPTECSKLNSILLQAIPGNLLIMGVKDDGSRSLTLDLIQTITALGSKYINQLSYRDSWAFAVRKGKPHSAREAKDESSPVTLTLTRKPRLRHLLLSSASFDQGNYFSLTLNDQAQRAISYNKPDQRGIVMIVLDNQGKIIFNEIFDTYSSSSASEFLEEAIKTQISQSPNHLLILGVKDDGSRSLSPSLRQLISSLGSKEIERLGYRDSWCFLCRIGRIRSVKEGRHSSHPVSLSWVPKRLRLTHPPDQRYSIFFHPPNPSPSLSSSLPSSLQQIPSIPLSHRTHPPLQAQTQEFHHPHSQAQTQEFHHPPSQAQTQEFHHPPSQAQTQEFHHPPSQAQTQEFHHPPSQTTEKKEFSSPFPPPLSQGETLLHHRVKRDITKEEGKEGGEGGEGKSEGEGLKGGSERGREKEREGKEGKEERIEHSPDDLYHHPHPYHVPPRPPHQEENAEKYDVPPVQSVHHRHSTTGGQGVDIGMSVRNNRARRRDTFS